MEPTDRRITTIYGLRDPESFTRREGVIENDNEITRWVEYWDGDVLVHRSAHVTLKKLPEGFAQAVQGSIT